MSRSDVATLRSFNRHYTQRIGALEDRFMGLGRPLGQARLLFEIGRDGAPVLELRRRLGLDSGYLSRLLRALQDDGLAAVDQDPSDRRRRIASLTARGRREWRELDQRSDDLARRLLDPLTVGQRRRLADAIDIAERLLRVATVSFEVVDPRGEDAIRAMTEYFAELDARFDSGFDPGDTLETDAPELRRPDGAFVVAYADGEPVACGGLQTLEPRLCEIKRMWVDASWRGLGLGKRMLAELEAQATFLGHRRVRLDTNSVLTEAIAMYQAAGYRSIERYNDNPYAMRWFEKTLRARG